MKSHHSKYGMPFERVATAILLASAAMVLVAAASGVQISLVDRSESPRRLVFLDRGSDPVMLGTEVIALASVLPDPRLPHDTVELAPFDMMPAAGPAISPRRERLAAIVDGGTGAVLSAALSGTPLRGERAASLHRAQPRETVALLPAAPGIATPPLANIRDTRSMTRRFEQIGYNLEGVREGQDVPRLFLASLPGDLPSVDSVDDRKRLFIKALLPHILRVNESILEDRIRLQRLAARKAAADEIPASDLEWLEALAARYGETAEDFAALLRRHDVVPPSLALAQSIEESGWGTSRFALHGNALFGQRTFETGDGMVPLRRALGEQHEVKAFDHLHESVLTYVMNLNRHNAYREFRRLREAMRGRDVPMSGTVLAGSMGRYSERGQEYIDTIRTIMRTNDLAAFDAARLQDPRRLRVARESF